MIVIDEASNGEELLKKIRMHKPHVVLTDLVMLVMSGIDVIRKLKEEKIDVPCIALSTFNNEHIVVEAMETGAAGYIIKNAERGEIAAAIRIVHQGFPYYCKSTSLKVTRLLVQSPFNPYSKIPIPVFTEREKENSFARKKQATRSVKYFASA